MNAAALRRWFYRLLTADTLLVAALFIHAAMALSPHYTPERISAAWQEIALPVYLWAALLILGGLIGSSPVLAPKGAKPAKVPAKPLKRRWQIALILTAVLLIVLGIGNHGLHDVLYKAIQICTECIGLG